MNKISTVIAAFWPVLMALTSVSSASMNLKSEATCQNKIIFLPQLHRDVIFRHLDDVNDENVASSQFMISQFILKNPGIGVFSEQVDTDLDSDMIEGDLLLAATAIRKAFPHGIPSKYQELSADQKQYLIMAGADGVLFSLGKVPMLHRVVPNRNVQDYLFDRIKNLIAAIPPGMPLSSNPDLMFLVDDTRESYALNEINFFFKSNPKEHTAILIYGKNHDFARHQDLLRNICIQVPAEFKSLPEK